VTTISSSPLVGSAASSDREHTLTPEQQRAADLLGRGLTQREVARLVGRSERTLRSWLVSVDGFRQAVQAGAAEGALAPTVAGVLRGALGALTRDGRPDHATRLRAAALLLQNPDADALPAEEDSALPERAVLVYPAALELAAEDDDAGR
jgi:hypothetical protein